MDRNIDAKLISFYRAPISNCKPEKEMSLREIHDFIKTGRSGIVIKLRGIKDEKEARTYKASKFDHCTFSGIFTHRKEDGLVQHSGLLCLDFDHLDDVESVFQKLISDPRCPTALLFRSPSGDGLKWVVPIDVDQMSHEDWFYALSSYVHDTYGLEADNHCKDVCRACFLPRDVNVYMDEDVFSKPLFVPDSVLSDPEPVRDAVAGDDSFEAVVERIEDAQVDIAPDYNQWLSLGFALSDYLGEDGREYFHRLSRFNPKYDEQDTDKQYDNCLNARKDGITIGTFFYLAKKAGIDIGRIEVQIPAFTPQVYDNLPYLLQQVCDMNQSDEEADMMVLGAIAAITSTIPNVSGQYGGRKVFPNLYTYVVAPASAGKGRLALIRSLVQPIHERLRELNKLEWEQYRERLTEYKQSKDPDMEKPVPPPHRLHVIPANTSATAMYQILHDNGGVGFMMETEGDTLTNTLASDHGNYSDGLRKSFHNEPVSFLRRTNHEYVEVVNPKLSVLLSGTPGQVKKLIPDAENGLFSRFMYYHLPMKPQWNDVFADATAVSLDEKYADLGRIWYEVYQRISEIEQINFSFTPDHQAQFNAHFAYLHEEYFRRYGEGFLPSVRRMGLIVFKISMSLSLMRCLEYADEKVDFICEDVDFHTALTIGEILLEHAAKLYSTLPVSASGSKQGYRQVEAERKQKVYRALPEIFQRKEAIEIGKENGVSQSTIKRWLDTPQFIHLGLGKYAKVPTSDPVNQ